MRRFTIILGILMSLPFLSFSASEELRLSVIVAPEDLRGTDPAEVVPTPFLLLKEKNSVLMPEDSFSEGVEVIFKALFQTKKDSFKDERIEKPKGLYFQLSGLDNIFYRLRNHFREPLFKRGICKNSQSKCKISLPSIQVLEETKDLRTVEVRIFRYGAFNTSSLDLLPPKIKRNLENYLNTNTRDMKKVSGQRVGFILYTRLFFDSQFPVKSPHEFQLQRDQRRFRLPLKYASARIPLVAGRFLIEVDVVDKNFKRTSSKTSFAVKWGEFKNAEALKLN